MRRPSGVRLRIFSRKPAVHSGGTIVTELIYTLSQLASAWLGNVADLLPVGYAFGAGMVSTVNPCGFALLPAYLGLYLGKGTERFIQTSGRRRLGQALL